MTSKPTMRASGGWVGTIAAWFLAAVAGLAQAPATPPPPTGGVAGRVVDAATGRPLAGIVVRVSPDPRRTASGQITGPDGRFDFRQLPAGTYQVAARSGGTMNGPNGFIRNNSGFPIGQYIGGGVGQATPGGPVASIVLAEGERRSGLEISLWRGSVITGRVVDESGDPLVDVVVGAVRMVGDGRLLDGPTGRTNDLGEYRLSALAPGRYVVFVPQKQAVTAWSDVTNTLDRIDAAVASAGQPVPVPTTMIGVKIGDALVQSVSRGMMVGGAVPWIDRDGVFVYPTTFAPSSESVDTASLIAVGIGEERTGVDVVVRGTRGAAVSGIVSFGDMPAAGMSVRLVPGGGGREAWFDVAETLTDGAGRFVFPVVPVGSYDVVVAGAVARPVVPNGVTHSRGVAGGPGAWATVPISVDVRGFSDLAISMRAGVPISGRVVFEGAGVAPAGNTLRNTTLSLQTSRPTRREPAESPSAAIESDLTFRFAGVPPGRYVLRPSSAPGGWRVAAIEWRGRDIAEWPIDVEASGDTGLDGLVVRYRQSLPGADITVSGTPDQRSASVLVVFPASPSTWGDLYRNGRVRVVAVPVDGRVGIENLLAGDYLVAAIPADLAVDLQDGLVFDRVAAVALALRVAPEGRAAASVSVRRPR